MTSVTVILIAAGLILALVGIIGCILPFVPGPPLSFLSLIILSWAKHWEPFSFTFLLTMGILTLLLTVLDYIIPASGAKRYGASKEGIWGSVIGMPLGLIFFPPWGIILGGVAGAFLGEIISGKKGNKALQASWGVLLGYFTTVGLKLLFCSVVLFFYLSKIF